MTRGTISIKRKNGVFDNLWYSNSDSYLTNGLGEQIFNNLKTVDDIEKAPIIFRKSECGRVLDTSGTIGLTDNIQDIIDKYNDYSYIFDEENEKWEYYYFENGPHNLEEGLKNEEDEEEEDDEEVNPKNRFLPKECETCTLEQCYECPHDGVKLKKLFCDLGDVLARHNIEIRVPLGGKNIILCFNYARSFGINFDIDEGITQDTLREKF